MEYREMCVNFRRRRIELVVTKLHTKKTLHSAAKVGSIRLCHL